MKRRGAVGSVLGLAVLIGLDPGIGLAVSSGPGPSRATLASQHPAATTTVLASDRNPSRFGELVRLTAEVTSIGDTRTASPTGSVDVMDGVTTVCDHVAIDADGVASCDLRLAPDAHPLTAIYSGDAEFSVSSSAPLAQTVRAPQAGTIDTG